MKRNFRPNYKGNKNPNLSLSLSLSLCAPSFTVDIRWHHYLKLMGKESLVKEDSDLPRI
jgi:hypothetical protein